MTLHDPSARRDGDQAKPARWRRTGNGLRLPASLLRGGRRRRHRGTDLFGATPLTRQRGRRRLAAMESALARDNPRLASMFDVFNQLNSGEQPHSPERLPAQARPRLGAAPVAVLVTLAAVVALCFALSTQIGPATRQCTSSGTAAGATVTGTAAPAASLTAVASQTPAAGQSLVTTTPASMQSAAAAQAASAVVRSLDCAAYATDRQP